MEIPEEPRVDRNLDGHWIGMVSPMYEHHSESYEDRVDAMAEDMEKQDQQIAQAIVDYGMTPTYDTKNPSIDLEEMYKDLVQLSQHDVDTDDIVPELGEDEKAGKAVFAKMAPVDFEGHEYVENYDDDI